MYFLNSLMFVTCEQWPLLWLLFGALMWLLGWLFGRSRVKKLLSELEASESKNSTLVAKNENLQNEFKLVKSDYDKTNKRLITVENNLEANNGKLSSALSNYKRIESEKNKLVSERNNLMSVKNNLLTEKENWDVERKKLQENSLEAADANISNKAIFELKEKLSETERALAACEASKITEDKVSIVAPPPPPPSGGSKINQLISNSDSTDPSKKPDPSKKSDSGMGNYFKNTDLKIIEGVGPKIESILKNVGYHTWQDLSNVSDTDLQRVLDEAGPRYRMHNPSFWPNQARFAAHGDWDGLVQYQKEIDGDVNEPNSKAEKLYFKAMGFVAAKSDDLKVVEGIGPKIETLLKNAGIKNWTALASSDVSRLQDILTSAGDRYRLADPGTWPKQAELASAGKWTELKEYQDFLSGGKA